MTDATPPVDAPADQNPQQAQPGPGFRVLAQYLKDFSFENPRAPESLRIDGKPAIDMGVEMAANGRPDGLFELNLKLSIKATHENQPVFQIEMVYGGLFQIGGVQEHEVEPMLLIECPRYLFPFAREIIARATADGGFYPPFMLDPLDFAAIYVARQQHIAQQPAATGQA